MNKKLKLKTGAGKKRLLLESFINRKYICLLMGIVFVVSLLPLLYIAQYGHPCADDYSYGTPAMAALRETGSASQALSAAFNNARSVYDTWQGTFMGVFLMSIHPGIFSDGLYTWVLILILLSYVAANLFIFKIVLMDVLGTDLYAFGIVSMLILFLSLQFIYSPVSGFYWYNSAMYDTGFYSLALVLFGLLIKAVTGDNHRKTVLYGAFIIPIAFIIGGGNFVLALTTLCIMGLFLAYGLMNKRKQPILIAVLVLSVVSIGISIYLSASAPGNAIRRQALDDLQMYGMNPVMAVLRSYTYALDFMGTITRLPYLLAFACAAPLAYTIARESKCAFKFPGIATFLAFSIYASTFTPNLFSMSSFGPNRVININFHAYLLFALFALFYWCGWFARKFYKNRKRSNKNKAYTLCTQIILAILFVLACAQAKPHPYTSAPDALASVMAVKSLASGEAGAYHLENLNRQALYADSSITVVTVPPFSVKPYLLFFDDITPDPDDWRNKAVADSYVKEAVILAD